MSRVISRVTILITHIRGLITLLITTPEPPSSCATTTCSEKELAQQEVELRASDDPRCPRRKSRSPRASWKL